MSGQWCYGSLIKQQFQLLNHRNIQILNMEKYYAQKHQVEVVLLERQIMNYPYQSIFSNYYSSVKTFNEVAKTDKQFGYFEESIVSCSCDNFQVRCFYYFILFTQFQNLLQGYFSFLMQLQHCIYSPDFIIYNLKTMQPDPQISPKYKKNIIQFINLLKSLRRTCKISIAHQINTYPLVDHIFTSIMITLLNKDKKHQNDKKHKNGKKYQNNQTNQFISLLQFFRIPYHRVEPYTQLLFHVFFYEIQLKDNEFQIRNINSKIQHIQQSIIQTLKEDMDLNSSESLKVNYCYIEVMNHPWPEQPNNESIK